MKKKFIYREGFRKPTYAYIDETGMSNEYEGKDRFPFYPSEKMKFDNVDKAAKYYLNRGWEEVK